MDAVDERKEEGLTARFQLTGDEEFLQDHFAGFPVMPGVLMLESLRQASAALLGGAWRLKSVKDARFGQFVKPGSSLKVSVRRSRKDGASQFVDGRLDLVGEDGSPRGRALLAELELVPVSS